MFKLKTQIIWIVIIFSSSHQCNNYVANPNLKLIEYIKSRNGFISLWDFKEAPGNERKSSEMYPLTERNGIIKRANEGPVSGYSIVLDGNKYLSLPNEETNQLNIHGNDKEITVAAFIKWTGEQTGFIGGMWNEYQNGGRRQYGLFASLPYYNGLNQVCGHISKTGKPTPPFPFSIDYSASKQSIPKNEWCFVAFTYDGTYIKSFFNGEFIEREDELIQNTIGFEGYPKGLVQSKNPYYYPDGMGNNGSDFTVGAVLLKKGMGNFFKGYIGGLAIFNTVLSNEEIIKIHELSFK